MIKSRWCMWLLELKRETLRSVNEMNQQLFLLIRYRKMQTSCLKLITKKWMFPSEIKPVLSCHEHRSKHLHQKFIYRIFYKNAKKAAPNDPRISISHNLNPFPGKKIHSRYLKMNARLNRCDLSHPVKAVVMLILVT